MNNEESNFKSFYYELKHREIDKQKKELYRKLKKDSKITENEMEIAEKEIQKVLDNATNKVDAMTKEKENELMEV